MTGQFLPRSSQNEICYQVPITFDGVIEQDESFTVDLTIDTVLPESVREMLTVVREPLVVVIEDSSKLRD